MTESTFTVVGMTCGHCAQSVTEEVSKIGGVSEVAVDLPTGAVTVSSGEAISAADVRTAVEEAGYQLAGS
ncbi:heavy-metal-associated domain-containing protein [Saccharopolyspora sp. NPDC002376]